MTKKFRPKGCPRCGARLVACAGLVTCSGCGARLGQQDPQRQFFLQRGYATYYHALALADDEEPQLGEPRGRRAPLEF